MKPAIPVGQDVPAHDLAGILEAIEHFQRRYVVFANDWQPVATTLWVAHSHAIESADATGYLEITSPVKRSGKTRELEVLELLVPRALRTANISDAALFRLIDEGRPTILLDEADAIFGPKSDREDLRALLNAGYRRGAQVARCETNGKKQEVRRFDAFSAKAIAAIGALPDTVSDRCIPIRLQRRTPNETVERFRYREAAAAAAPIRAQLAAWAEGVHDELRDARPALPDALNDRAQDAWEPLLAIADAAGSEWGARAREAAVALHDARGDYVEEELPMLALRHVREVFAELGDPESVWTADLLRALVQRDDAPWAEFWLDNIDRDRIQAPAQRLRRLLHPFGVEPSTVRIGATTRKGYHLKDLADTAARHLGKADTSSQAVTALARDVTAVSAVTAPGEGVEPVSAPEVQPREDPTAAMLARIEAEGDPSSNGAWRQVQREAGEVPELDETEALRVLMNQLGAARTTPEESPVLTPREVRHPPKAGK
jgi:hypothetical protein